jgi:hypothetical protein
MPAAGALNWDTIAQFRGPPHVRPLHFLLVRV